MKRWAVSGLAVLFFTALQFSGPLQDFALQFSSGLCTLSHRLSVDPKGTAPLSVDTPEFDAPFLADDFVQARVYGYGPSGLSREILLKTADSVREDAPLLCGFENALCGRIVWIEGTNVRARLVYDPDFALAGQVQGKDTLGVITGNTYSILLRQIPDVAEIEVGDIIVTARIGEGIPKGIPVGRVVNVVDDPDSIFKTAEIEAPYTLSTINTVQIPQ